MFSDGSTATPLPAPQPGERRASPRFETDLPARLLGCTGRVLEGERPGRVLNISKDGLKARFWHDVPAGTHFSLSIQFNDDASLCIGEVVWKRDSAHGMVYGLRVKHWTYLDPTLGSALVDLEKRTPPGGEPPRLLSVLG